MKSTCIQQLIKLEKVLWLNGYEIIPKINRTRNHLILTSPLKGDNDKDIMAQWNDVKKAGS